MYRFYRFRFTKGLCIPAKPASRNGCGFHEIPANSNNYKQSAEK